MRRFSYLALPVLIVTLLGFAFIQQAGAAAAVAPSPTAFESDDFNTYNLNVDLWTLVNPVGDGSIAMTGAGTGNAYLRLTAPEGVSHDAWKISKAVRVMQPAEDTDFEVEVKFDSIPSEEYQLQGIHVAQDDGTYLLFEVYHTGTKLNAFAASTRNGKSRRKIRAAIQTPPAGSLYLRVNREGNQWIFSYSEDGQSWTTAGRFTQKLAVSEIGVFAGNHNPRRSKGPAPAYTAVVDYFANTAQPFTDEDAAPVVDTQPPLIHAIRQTLTKDGLLVNWSTDELSVELLEYGKTKAYENEPLTSQASYNHSILLPELVAGSTYHYRISAIDSYSNVARTENFTATAPRLDPIANGIHVWYGLNQLIGRLGQPQRWVNILGNIARPQRIRSLTYSLNDGREVRLRLGRDGRRLVASGDFNADIPLKALQPGTNTVRFTARERRGGSSTTEVLLDFQPGNEWPLPYRADWRRLPSVEAIQDVAQVVDGEWTLARGQLRTANPGYDRLVAIGDRDWTNYEVVVPVTLHKTSNGAGIGILVRWNGHTNNPVATANPKSGWLPLGAIGWYYKGRLELYGNGARILGTRRRTLQKGIPYIFKMQVQTLPGGSPIYRFKVWRQGRAEPRGWDIERRGRRSDPKHGSMLLVAHKADVSFGPVIVTPLE